MACAVATAERGIWVVGKRFMEVELIGPILTSS